MIGKDVPRVELPLKVTGKANYAMDVQVPGMVYAAVLQAPYFEGAPQSVDDAAARKVPGIADVVRLPEGVAVIGSSVEGTQAAKKLLKVTWSDAKGASLDSERALRSFRRSPATRAATARCSPRKATPKRRCNPPPRSCTANTARAMSTTRRWSR